MCVCPSPVPCPFSATFNYLTSTLVTMLMATLFLIPGVNPFPAYTPVWSVLTSLALSIVGVVLWKSWELTATPVLADQFGLKADVAGGRGAGGRVRASHIVLIDDDGEAATPVVGLQTSGFVGQGVS